ncbi:hypothetical protein [Paenimyroides ceti]
MKFIEKIIFLLIFIIILGCNKNKIIKEKHLLKNDTVEYIYKQNNIIIRTIKIFDGKPISISFFENNAIKQRKIFLEKDKQYIINYDGDGVIKSTYYAVNEKKIGWEKKYRNDGSLEEEMFIINEEGKQVKYYKENGLIDRNKSFYAEVLIEDTLNRGKHIGKIIYNAPYKEGNFLLLLLSKNIKQDFSNMLEVQKDTFGSYSTEIYFELDTKNIEGSYPLRGYIMNIDETDPKENVPIMIIDHTIFIK